MTRSIRSPVMKVAGRASASRCPRPRAARRRDPARAASSSRSRAAASPGSSGRSQPHVAEPPSRRARATCWLSGIEADVEVDGADPAARRSQVAPARRTPPRSWPGLLAHDVTAGGEDLLDLRKVEVVRRGDVHDLDPARRRAGRRGCRTPSARRSQRARAAPLGGEPRRPWTWTPRRRRASIWTVPMNPLPMHGGSDLARMPHVATKCALSRRQTACAGSGQGLLGGNWTVYRYFGMSRAKVRTHERRRPMIGRVESSTFETPRGASAAWPTRRSMRS